MPLVVGPRRRRCRNWFKTMLFFLINRILNPKPPPPECAQIASAHVEAETKRDGPSIWEQAALKDSETARRIAPEDITPGMTLTVIEQVNMFADCFMRSDAYARYYDAGTPLRVISVAIPFVLVKAPCGEVKTLDLTQLRLMQLPWPYAKQAWKALKQQQPDKYD